MSTPTKVYGLKMSHDGLRIFFFGVYGTDIYYLIPWFIWQVQPAFLGLAGGDGRVPYTVNYDGQQALFQTCDHSRRHLCSRSLLRQRRRPDLYPHLMMPMSKLPGTQNTNLLRYLGSSEYGGSLLCTWYFGSISSNSTAMWRVPTLQPPQPLRGPGQGAPGGPSSWSGTRQVFTIR